MIKTIIVILIFVAYIISLTSGSVIINFLIMPTFNLNTKNNTNCSSIPTPNPTTTPANRCELNLCQNGASCLTDLSNQPVCVCPEGYFGQLCENLICENGSCLDGKCTNETCLNDGICIQLDNQDQFQCICKEDFTGKTCEINLDSCHSAPCQNGGVCSNTSSQKFNCSCPAQFSGTLCEIEL